jgi:hypothetical protein
MGLFRYNSLNVFEENNPRLALEDSRGNGREQVTRVIDAFLSSSNTEGLTREPSREDVHASTKLVVREGFNVRVDRRRIQETFFHLCNQVRRTECFPLHVSDFTQSWEKFSESKPNAFVSATKAEVCNCFGNIHIVYELRVNN